MQKNKVVSLMLTLTIVSFLLLIPYNSKAYATYSNDTYIEDFNNYGDFFTNTSGHQNVTCGLGNRQGGLQLNYTSSEIISKNPSDGDNLTEHSSHVSKWDISGTAIANSSIERGSPVAVGTYSIRFRFNCTTGSWVMITFRPGSSEILNLTGYEKLNYWITSTYSPASGIPVLLLESLVLYDNHTSVKGSWIFPNTLIRGMPLVHYHSFDFDEFTTDSGFNYENISSIHWFFVWYPTGVYNRTTGEQMLNIDGFHFAAAPTTQYTFENSGVWYSDWIDLSGDGESVFVNTNNPDNVTLLISDDNATWNRLSTTTVVSISQYGYSSRAILQIQLNKTSSGDSPIVDYIVLTTKVSEPSPILFLPPAAPTIDPLIIYGIMGALGTLIVIEAVIIIRKRKT